jgi:hypothetical protein
MHVGIYAVVDFTVEQAMSLKVAFKQSTGICFCDFSISKILTQATYFVP